MPLCLFFSRFTLFVGVLVFLSIIGFNIKIFRKKNLYEVYYPAYSIPEKPQVSIVIIAYNEEQYIGKLLDSIKLQTYSNYEVILVDDHSADRTLEIAKGYKSYFSLKIVQKEICGASRSRNYGATFGQGEILLFLDADVILPDSFISDNLKTFIEQKLSIGGVDFISITENKIDIWIAGLYRIWLRTVQYFNPRGIGFCLFVLRELHKQVLFDEAIVMSEDFDYVKRASQHGKFRIIPTTPLKVSWRRFNKENRFLLILKYLFFEWYRQNIGEIRKNLLPYDFGNLSPTQK